MTLPLFLQGLGSVGIFASRAFLPAFVTALLLRLGPTWPWLAHSGLIPHLRGVPTWFTSDAALIVLGLLSAAEFAAGHSPEARAYLDEIHHYLKAGMAALTYLGVLDATDRAAVAPLIRAAGLFDLVPAVLVASATLLATRARDAVLGPIGEADEDDDLGAQRLLRWVGDLWAALGPVALIAFPLLAIAAFALAAGILFLAERKIGTLGDRSRVACANCGRMIHPSTPACPNCGVPATEPRSIDLLGRPGQAAANPATLPFQLAAVKRCPHCATRFDRRAVKQECPACGRILMADPDFAAAYVAFIDRRVPLTCLACGLLGLIPILGVIPGVIYYRLTIVAPFRRYIPAARGWLLRWGIRLAVVVLVALQWIPVAGAFALPTMALISYAAYRTAYRGLALTDPGSSG